MTKKSSQPDDDETPTIGHNKSPDAMELLCRDADKEMSEVEEARDLLNEKANKVRAGLREQGIDTDAWQAARKHAKKTDDKRLIFDTSYQITRKALGTPVQDDLFQD